MVWHSSYSPATCLIYFSGIIFRLIWSNTNNHGILHRILFIQKHLKLSTEFVWISPVNCVRVLLRMEQSYLGINLSHSYEFLLKLTLNHIQGLLGIHLRTKFIFSLYFIWHQGLLRTILKADFMWSCLHNSSQSSIGMHYIVIIKLHELRKWCKYFLNSFCYLG